MSYLIVRCLCPHYEDYDPIGMERNAVQGWPALWEPERYAEGALYEEFKAMREQAAVMHRYAKTTPVSAEESVLIRALVSIARENKWKVQNADLVKNFHVHTVFTIPPSKEDEPMPERWRDIVRWMDRQKTREEEAEVNADKEREAKRRRDNRIMIDGLALLKMMGDMMPVDVIRESPLKHDSTIIQALVELADEGEWKMNDPECGGWSGFYEDTPRVFRIR